MLHDIITIGSATRDVFLLSRAMHPHRAPDALTHIEACFPFGAKINIEQIHFDTGGGATNNAVTFARLGKFRTAALCRVGADSAGQDIMRALAHDRVDTSLIQTARNEQTAYSTIISPGGEVGERTILVYRGASHRFNHSHIPWQKMKARWFYISSLDGDLALLKKILAHAKKINAQVAWNPGGQEIERMKNYELRMKNLIDFLIVNREEASRLTGVKFANTQGLLRALINFAPSTIMTDGPKGAYAVIGKQPTAHRQQLKPYVVSRMLSAYYVPSAGHRPKNLTGAGDAFGSGLLTGWIKSGGDIKYALRLASFNADSVVQHVGAKVGILRRPPAASALHRLPIKTIPL